MVLPTSGSLRLGQIQSEFGGTSPTSISEYYRNAAYTTRNNDIVPLSGQIRISNFRGAVNTAWPIPGPYFSASFNSNSSNKSVVVSNLSQFGAVAPKTLIVAHQLTNTDGDIGESSAGVVVASDGISCIRDAKFFSTFSDETHYISFYRVSVNTLNSVTLSIIGERQGSNDGANGFTLFGWVIPNDVNLVSTATGGNSVSIVNQSYGVTFVSAIRNFGTTGNINDINEQQTWSWTKFGHRQFSETSGSSTYSSSGALGMIAATYSSN